jgi:hypothetical protein
MKKKSRRISLMLGCLCFSGCVSYDTSWTPIAGTGPYLSGTSYAHAFRKCEQRLMDGARQCAIAFEDEDGLKHEVFHDLVGELDGLVMKVPGANLWPKTRSYPAELKVPYKLFLVTISPIIIVAVPAPPLQTEHCWVDAPDGKCLRSYIAASNGYSLSTAIPVVEGTVWLSSASAAQGRTIPIQVGEYKFPLDGVDANLIQKDGIWNFFRKPQKAK